jgi:hemerythrin
MALMIWNSDYSVGVESLDSDHIVIASLINHIDDAKQFGSDEAAVGRILAVLIDQARAHFRREEKLLEKHGYPELEEHRKVHRLVEEQLTELQREYQRSQSSEISQEIMELLSYWLDDHILKVDMRYKAYLQKRVP